MPYYSQQSKLRSDVYDFMGTLLNVYVLLFILAATVAIKAADNITKPIVAIMRRIRQVRLGGFNEKIKHERRDEIGELVLGYNDMVDKLSSMEEDLKESARESAWREMAKQVAHEIKNPLTPMKLNMQFLVKRFREDPESAAPLIDRTSEAIIQEIEKLRTIATEFSSFAKMPPADNRVFLLNELVQRITRMHQDNDEDEVDFRIDVTEEPLRVFADEQRLNRVLTNLIINSKQAIPVGRRGSIYVRLHEHHGRAVIEVRDNGEGISDEMLEKVFKPNFTTKRSGTGLGLAMCRNIINQANGKIHFRTKVGVGTTFFVELPLVEDEL